MNTKFQIGQRVRHTLHVPAHDSIHGIVVGIRIEILPCGSGTRYFVRWIDGIGKLGSEPDVLDELELVSVGRTA